MPVLLLRQALRLVPRLLQQAEAAKAVQVQPAVQTKPQLRLPWPMGHVQAAARLGPGSLLRRLRLHCLQGRRWAASVALRIVARRLPL